MGQYARAFRVCEILAKEHPKGLSMDDLFAKCKEADPRRFAEMSDLRQIMGLPYQENQGDKRNPDWGVQCWKKEGNSVVYDPTSLTYIQVFEPEFAIQFNQFLKREGLNNLILFEPPTPENSEFCPLGIHWRHIPNSQWCNYNHRDGGCRIGCGLDREKVQAWLRGDREEPY